MLDAVDIPAKTTHRATIIWLHGLGADGHDFAPIARELKLPESMGVRFILPHAPQRPVTINGGMVMRAWYDIAYTDIGRTPDLQGIADSLKEITHFIEAEKKAGIPSQRILIAGFSQGGVLAIESISQFQDEIGGAIALSGYLARSSGLPEATGTQRIFLAHGTEDPIVPFDLGLSAKKELESKGYEVTWGEWRMPHSVCIEEIEAIRAWILETLAD
ncbi:MAG TPA: carboxylesterase [Methylococcaceae bacterium]|jgi:phospholipase/carboxylesterase|nr:carboxylesterase [Methylococcaceae bacterium]